MSSSTSVAIVGAVLVVAALAADVALTLAGHSATALVASVGQAGIAIATHTLLARRANRAHRRESAVRAVLQTVAPHALVDGAPTAPPSSTEKAP